MKTKIKIIKFTSLTILMLISIIGLSALIMSLNTTSYSMAFNTPSQIIVYYNEEIGNQVYEPDSKEYNAIYSSVCNAYKQSTLKAFVKSNLNKKIKIEHVEPTAINFDGIKVNFVYSSPQVVKLKNSIYSNNGQTYWYQNLIFTISDSNDYQYNYVAIIPPVGDSRYVGPYTYSMNYMAYSNFGKTYSMLIEYFK